jgi:hypothetical protein
MASYLPPLYPTALFDPGVFIKAGEDGLTYDEALKYFLKYPNAQGTENLQTTNVNGVATFNTDANFETNLVMGGVAGTNYIEYPDGSKQYTASVAPSSLLASNNTWTGTNTFSNNVDIGSPTATNLTPVFDTHNSLVNLGNGSNGKVAVECELNIGGFGSLTMESSQFVLEADAYITQLPLTAPTINQLDATQFNQVPTCVATQPVASDSSTKIPTTAWVQTAISASIPTPITTYTYTATATGYNSGGNYTYYYFSIPGNWSAFSWIFYTPTASKTNVNKGGLGSSPPLNVGIIGANGSFIFMNGIGISQGYTASSSNMITYCAGFQQNYSISAGSSAPQFSITSCIGGTPAAPFFTSNQLSENNGTCPPSANGLGTGTTTFQLLNGDYTGLGLPTIVITPIIA